MSALHEIAVAALKTIGAEGADIKQIKQVGGGCINLAAYLQTSKGDFFVKWQASSEAQSQFNAEYQGLLTLKQVFTGLVPRPLATGVHNKQAWLLMDWVDQSPQTTPYWEALGEALAALHQQTAPLFGLDYPNYIGSLPQRNERHINWVSFYISERLVPQLAFAERRQLIDATLLQQFEALFVLLPDLLPAEPPALIHGDLWSGNVMAGPGASPCIFDPAIYFAHREMEIAFTHLFGGFDSMFYSAYHAAYPLLPGFEQRMDLYQLYPLLVHVNLFGASYLSGVKATLRRYLS